MIVCSWLEEISRIIIGSSIVYFTRIGVKLGLNNRVQMYQWKRNGQRNSLQELRCEPGVICKLENGANVNPTARLHSGLQMRLMWMLGSCFITKEENGIMVDEAEKCRREIIREVRSIEKFVDIETDLDGNKKYIQN